MKDDSIMIKSPEKGSVIVILEKNDYLRGSSNELDDNKIMKKLTRRSN